MERPKLLALVEYKLDEGDTPYVCQNEKTHQRPLIANDSKVAFSRHTTSEPRTSPLAEAAAFVLSQGSEKLRHFRVLIGPIKRSRGPL